MHKADIDVEEAPVNVEVGRLTFRETNRAVAKSRPAAGVQPTRIHQLYGKFCGLKGGSWQGAPLTYLRRHRPLKNAVDVTTALVDRQSKKIRNLLDAAALSQRQAPHPTAGRLPLEWRRHAMSEHLAHTVDSCSCLGPIRMLEGSPLPLDLLRTSSLPKRLLFNRCIARASPFLRLAPAVGERMRTPGPVSLLRGRSFPFSKTAS